MHNIKQLRQQIVLLGEQFGYPIMVEEYLPSEEITAAVFMTPERPAILATYYEMSIYEDPAAVLDRDVRMLDWDDKKSLRVVTEPKVLAQIEALALAACRALNITEFTRIDCRLDRHGKLKVFDINGLPGLELPFSATVWQMIVKMDGHTELYAFDTLLALVVYCALCRHHIDIPPRIRELAEDYMAETALVDVV